MIVLQSLSESRLISVLAVKGDAQMSEGTVKVNIDCSLVFVVSIICSNTLEQATCEIYLLLI